MPPSDDKTGLVKERSGRARRLSAWVYVPVALAVALSATLWYATTQTFNAWLRGQVVARLEQATGGRVELGALTWRATRLEFTASNLTIHGLEDPGQIPYAHVERLSGRLRVMPFWGGVRLTSLVLERPVFHLIVNADGTTNQPVPRQPGRAGPPVGRFFEIGIGRLEVSDGRLLLNERTIPLDAAAEQVWLALSAAEAGRRYDGELRFGPARVKAAKLAEVEVEGSAAFRLWPNRAELSELKLRSGASHLEAAGELRDFAHPAGKASYTATVEMARFGPLLGASELRGGMLTLAGEGNWQEREFTSTGKLLLQDAHFVNRTFRVPAVTVGAEYTVTPERISLGHIFGSVFGGTAVGELEIANWRESAGAGDKKTESAAKPARGLPWAASGAGGPAGELRLRGEHMLLGRIAEALASRNLPLDKARLAGSGSVTVLMQWRGSADDAVTKIMLEAEPARRAAAGELPAVATMRATYRARAGEMEIAGLKVTTAASEFQMSGTLNAERGRLALGLDTRALDEWKPLLAAAAPGAWPVEVKGRTTFRGTLSGNFRAPTVTGHLEVRDFTSQVSLSRLSIKAQAPGAKSGVATAPRLHWDGLEATLEYSPTRLAVTKGTLERGQSRVNFEVMAELRQGRWTEEAPMRLRLEVRNGNAAELLALFGDTLPVTGTLQARWQVEGSLADTRGSGTVTLARATLWGEPFERASARMTLGGHEVQFTEVEAAHNGATVRGSGNYNLATTAFRFEVRTKDLNLASVASLQRPELKWSGLVSLAASGEGTLDAPAINAEVTAAKLAVNGERIGEVKLSAVTKGDQMTLRAQSPGAEPAFVLQGTLRLRQDYPAEIAVRARGLSVDPLLRLALKDRTTAHLAMTGALSLRGPLRAPEKLHAEADVEELAGEIEHVALHNDGPLRVTLDDNRLRLERLALTGSDTNLTARGSVGLGSPATLDLTARGRVNLKLLQSFDPNLTSSGNCTVNVQVNGTSAHPLLSGRLELANVGLAYADLPNGLSDMRGRLVFNQDRLQVESLTARTGGGTLELGGFISYSRGLSFNLTASGRDLRLRYPPGVSTAADATLALTGTAQNALLAGTVTITRFGVNPQYDFGPYLARAKESVATVTPDSPAARLRLDVRIASRPELQVETSLGRVSGDIDLRLRGTVARPALLGRVSIAEGNVSIYGTRYHIQRGDITFTSPVGIEPVLDIQTTANVRSYDITLGFHGPINKLSTTYRSDPPLSTADIVSLLAFGRTREETAAQTATGQSLPETASYAILNQALSAAVTSRMQKIFGVSRIKIDPLMQSPAGLEYSGAGPTVTIEQQVANKLTVTYVSNLSRSNYQTIQAEYNVNRNVSIVAVRDWNGILSFDIRVRQRRR
jgi:translocation and assembly module TamB